MRSRASASCGRNAGAVVTCICGGAVIHAPDVVSNLGVMSVEHGVTSPIGFKSRECGSKNISVLLVTDVIHTGSSL